jgi:gluconokinase
LSGERAPIWDAESSGAFIGLTLNHTQEHIVRAVLEGICYALNDVLLGIERYSGKITQISVSGGFVHSRIWMKILSDVTGKTVIMVQQDDASA